MLSYEDLSEAVGAGAAFSRRRRLQPIGGRSDKIFPPTYPGEGNNAPPRHIFERRRLPEGGATREVWCVLIDSVQSQANRLEEALLAAAADGLELPRVTVDFRGLELEPLEQITSLDAPHRVYDAILRDSALDGVRFMESEPGKRLAGATPRDASALLELSPSALLFGAWHSQGEGGGLGAKFARALVSEIVGVDVPVENVDAPMGRSKADARTEQIAVVDARTGEVVEMRAVSVETRTAARRPGSRIDPLGVLRKVEVFKGPNGWSFNATEAGKGAKKVRPSEVNHSNIAPSVAPLGVTCDHAEHAFTLSFAALRRLRFGGAERDAAGRALLAALGLVALTEQDARGYALRSRCDLVPEEPAPLRIVRADGARDDVELDRERARALYERAFGAAKAAGFRFESLTLKPQDKLVTLVRESRRLALEGKGGEDGDASGG
jgi:CRISPR-associated protein Csb1